MTTIRETIYVPELVNWLKHYIYSKGMSESEYKSVARHILNMPSSARQKFVSKLEVMWDNDIALIDDSPYGRFTPGISYFETDDKGKAIRRWNVRERKDDLIILTNRETNSFLRKTVFVYGYDHDEFDFPCTEYVVMEGTKVSAALPHLPLTGVYQ